MSKSDEQIREAVTKGLASISSGFCLALLRVEDPSVAALILSGVEGVTMSVENGKHVFRLDPGPYLEELLKAAAGHGLDQISVLRKFQYTLQQAHHMAIESLARAQRTVEAAARLWRPVNVVVAGVREDGGERR